MKTRVSRNSDLYDKIASDLESDAQSKDLSQFAQRLNQIDKQFNHTDVRHNETAPHRAKQSVLLEKELVSQKENNDFDTFESTYLKEFLDEVKDYNVKKGYRDVHETSSNILNDLNLDLAFSDKTSAQELYRTEKESAQAAYRADKELAPSMDAPEEDFSQAVYQDDNDTPFVPKDFDMVFKDLDPLLNDTYETEKIRETNLDETRQFKAIDHESKFDNSHLSLDETIALAIQKMDENEESLNIEDSESNQEMDQASRERFESYEMTQELMNHTQTLQHKIVDQERNIEEMNHTMIRTNRMLNAVISLIIMAIIVVLMLIVSTYWR